MSGPKHLATLWVRCIIFIYFVQWICLSCAKFPYAIFFINHALGYFEPFRSFLFHNQVTPYWVETLLGGYYEPCFFPHAQMRCFCFSAWRFLKGAAAYSAEWLSFTTVVSFRGGNNAVRSPGFGLWHAIAYYGPMAENILPILSIYVIYIYIYLSIIYIYISIYISFGYVYVMFECLARCTCKFTQPHTCITSFHKLRNKQMNEWMKERKNEWMNEWHTHTHCVYIYIYIDIYIYMKMYRLYFGC